MKRLYPDHPVVGVGAVILREGKILLEKRKNEPARGRWSIPGGVVDVGESLEDAVIRETKEETGLEVETPTLIDVVYQVDRDGDGKVKYHFVIIDYLVHVKCGEPEASSDADALKWVAFDEVEKYDLTASFRRFFQKNKEKLENFSAK
ncbi:MAG TPA: NUDIX hydrolase [Candidatus Bathyarchaeia archaeon]|nr:NUDIX hydrolase [Candidatus Bathyarchaeia archaeon]